MELLAPAGARPALEAAVAAGADAVYVGLRDDTNARAFPGLNFAPAELVGAAGHAHAHGAKLLVAINTFARPSAWPRWRDAVDAAARAGVDALIAADIAVLDYAHRTYPELALHLSVQGSATTHEALTWYHRKFAIRRAVLPRVLSMKQIERLATRSPVPLEVFGFGSLCIMVEGRCLLSSYVTGQSPNRQGVCSPGSAVRWVETPAGVESRLNGVLINRFAPGERAGYPTICKGRYEVAGRTGHAIEEPVSLNTLALLPELERIGIVAVKIEGRQRSPAYVSKVVTVWREALDAMKQGGEAFYVRPAWAAALREVSEGGQTTFGAYDRGWQ